MRLKTAFLPLTMPLILAACLGGGGGGSSSSGQSGPLTLDSPATAFTSFADITANSLVEASAGSSVNYAAGEVGGIVQQDGALTTNQTSALRILTGDEIPPADPLDDPEFEFGGLRLIVNLAAPDAVARDFVEEPATQGDYEIFEIVDGVDVTDQLVLNEAESLEYMVFGIWATGLGSAAVDLGGAAWGAATPTVAGDLPNVGAATYNGSLIGHNVRAGSTTTFIADSTIAVDFDVDSVSLSATNTRQLLNEAITDPGLNILASAGLISGNTFSGSEINLQAAGSFSGSYGGAFYGPNAAEAGGWFEVTNTGQPAGAQDRYFGSFGGAQVP